MYHVMCGSRVKDPCVALVMIVGIADEEGAPKFLLLLCWGLLLVCGTVDCNVAWLPTLVTLCWFIGVRRATSTPVITFLVEDLCGSVGLVHCVLISSSSGCSSDVA